ncbi:hypothetical protein L1987_77044 [Smallanthus sonchifolius]|uniref:Uncharacterized protein n=1 Tax=Smallanthus sonchifolius TaxID=185202 RepID=A0ACB8Z8P8_9ASTR|nr:hypothetical protein L1987_77044 [Smallanthus sonchifolius]
MGHFNIEWACLSYSPVTIQRRTCIVSLLRRPAHRHRLSDIALSTLPVSLRVMGMQRIGLMPHPATRIPQLWMRTV